MISLWISNKLRFVSYFIVFFTGMSFVLLPWYLGLVFLAFALFFDYLSFKFEKKGEAV